MITIRVPASSANIGPGFDILGLALNLYSTIHVETENNKELSIQYFGEGKDIISCDENNLVYRAIGKVFGYVKKSLTPMQIEIHNDIPLKGGLGSSSSAIVSGIMAGNILCGNLLDQEQLLQLAVELDGHPDNVTPALFGGFTFAYLDEDKYKYIPLRFPEDLDIITISPSFHVSTEEARKVMPKNYPMQIIIQNTSKLVRLIRGLEENNLSSLKTLLDDQFHQPYRFPLVPGFQVACEEAYRHGALGAFISGSGPTLAIFTRENKENISQQSAKIFQSHGLNTIIRFLKPDLKGAQEF